MYVTRSAYGLALLILMSTAWLVLTGTQVVHDVGDLARFGMSLFQLLAPLQLAVVVFFAALLTANAVSQEKDRRTLDLLLLTKMSNSELVLGRLLASLLNVFVLLAAGLPVFMLVMLFGGVSPSQIGRVFAVTLASVVVCGSLGSTIALWREKTFQSLAVTMLVLVLWLAGWRLVAMGLAGSTWFGMPAETWAVAASPFEAVLEASRPYLELDPILGGIGTPVDVYLFVAAALVVGLNGLAIARVRVWNPSREVTFQREDETWRRTSLLGADSAGQRAGEPQSAPAASRPRAHTREVWDNPVIWREIATWAYGRKILIVRLAYLVLFALAAGGLVWQAVNGQPITRSTGGIILGPLFLLSLVLVNAQAVTSLTSERDGRTLDLLLVSDLTPKEFMFGKLGGVFYNTKEMVALPMLLCGYVWYIGALGFGARGVENLLFLWGGLAVLYGFVAMVGVHAGMTYANCRSAIATSLGTVFFLFLGVATCMWMMVAFSGSFEGQLPPFLAFMVGGGVGLYAALGARNPSPAVAIAAFGCPFATFYAITSLFLNYTLGVFVVTAVAYGFAIAAMLVPAIYEFDVATGRTTVTEE